jgi:endonuclease YncB( thermonuclease family)
MYLNGLRAAALLTLLATQAFAGAVAIDGDTVDIDGERIRIYNIDTPEIHSAKCDAERRLGLVAKRRMQDMLDGGDPVIIRGDHGRLTDRYGRTLARLEVRGNDLGEKMVGEGLARTWTGKRRPWCGET